MSLQSQLDRIDREIKKSKSLLKDPELASLAQEELEKLEKQKQALEQSIATTQGQPMTRKSTNPEKKFDHANAIVEIRGAAGGDEAKIWAGDLLRMYVRFAENAGYKVSVIDEGVIKVSGKGVYGTLKYESGVHRVQRVPETEKQGRIHTSTATVAVLPEITESEIKINPDELEWQFTRAGGPGGQYVNKAATAVRLTHKPTGTVISVRQERLQQQNKAIALELLRARLWEIEEEKRLKAIKKTRKSAVGRGMRAEKIRTYNFPQNRVTDHRMNESWHELESILNGNLTKILSTLNENDRQSSQG